MQLKSDEISKIIKEQIKNFGNIYDNPINLFVAKFLGTPPINVFEGEVRGEHLFLGYDNVLAVPGVADQKVYVGIRPEGFIVKEDGPLTCELVGVEVMGRDISVISTHELSLNPTVRTIISTANKLENFERQVQFALVPHKVMIFNKETEERIDF